MGINRNGTGQTNLHIEQFKLDDLNNLPTKIKVRDIHGYSRWLSCTDVSANDIPTLQITRNGVYGFLGGRVEADVGAWDIEPYTITENNIEIVPDLGVKYSPITVALPMEEKTITTNGTYTPSGDNQGFTKVTVDVPIQSSKTITANGTYTPDEGYEGISSVYVSLPSASGLIDKTSTQFVITSNDIVTYGPSNGYSMLASLKPSSSLGDPNPPVRLDFGTSGCSFKYSFSYHGKVGANLDYVSEPFGYRTYFKTMTLSDYESAWTARSGCYNAANIDLTGVSQADFLTLCQTYRGDFSFSGISASILDNWTSESVTPIYPGVGVVRLAVNTLSTTRLFGEDSDIRVVILNIGMVTSSASGLCYRVPNLESVWLEGTPPSGTYPGSWFNNYDGIIYVNGSYIEEWKTWFGDASFVDRISSGSFNWYSVSS